MTPNDAKDFMTLIADVYAFYRHDFSPFAGRVWWNAMQPFDLAAVQDALGRHSMNPDTGHLRPFPSDIVKMLQGSTQDSALAAWSKVDRGIRTVGPHRSVAFDDPLIHRVVTEMGGWIELARKDDKEWPFLRNEFVNRYRGYRMRNEIPPFPPYLIGVAEAQNAKEGKAVEPPLLLGNPEQAAGVLERGADVPLLAVTTMAQLATNAVPALPDETKPKRRRAS
ncbi:DUF6475 domain-containing protein [Cupriavidus metallidurans]